MIGTGIKESLGDMLPKNPFPKISIPEFLGGKGDETTSLIRETIPILREIRDNSKTASWA
jgi:hypothetical protein